MLKKFLLSLTLLVAYHLNGFSQDTLSFKDKHISYQGRILFTNDAATLMWPGTSFTVNFVGTGISGIFKDQDTSNYYNIIIDKDSIRTIQFDTVKKVVPLAEGLPYGKHSLRFLKERNGIKEKPGFMV